VPYLTLHVFMAEEATAWHLVALRPAEEWQSRGPYYWERRGQVGGDDRPTTHREMISRALQDVQNRLGEREDLGAGRQ
jgi:hypothetical protein